MSGKSFKIEVIADSSGKWVGNDLRFATRLEAEAYAADLSSRWTLVRDFRVVESHDPANRGKMVAKHKYPGGHLIEVSPNTTLEKLPKT